MCKLRPTYVATISCTSFQYYTYSHTITLLVVEVTTTAEDDDGVDMTEAVKATDVDMLVDGIIMVDGEDGTMGATTIP